MLGTPGAPWTEYQAAVLRAKLERIWKYQNHAVRDVDIGINGANRYVIRRKPKKCKTTTFEFRIREY